MGDEVREAHRATHHLIALHAKNLIFKNLILNILNIQNSKQLYSSRRIMLRGCPFSMSRQKWGWGVGESVTKCDGG